VLTTGQTDGHWPFPVGQLIDLLFRVQQIVECIDARNKVHCSSPYTSFLPLSSIFTGSSTHGTPCQLSQVKKESVSDFSLFLPPPPLRLLFVKCKWMIGV
jgi:hypothetical protein